MFGLIFFSRACTQKHADLTFSPTNLTFRDANPNICTLRPISCRMIKLSEFQIKGNLNKILKVLKQAVANLLLKKVQIWIQNTVES